MTKLNSELNKKTIQSTRRNKILMTTSTTAQRLWWQSGEVVVKAVKRNVLLALFRFAQRINITEKQMPEKLRVASPNFFIFCAHFDNFLDYSHSSPHGVKFSSLRGLRIETSWDVLWFLVSKLQLFSQEVFFLKNSKKPPDVRVFVFKLAQYNLQFILFKHTTIYHDVMSWENKLKNLENKSLN